MRLLTIILFLFCSSLANAAPTNIDPRVAKFDTCGRYELFSINGIMTDIDGAAENMTRIQAVYGNSYKEHLIKYVMAFNQTRGLKTDFLDSAKQVIDVVGIAVPYSSLRTGNVYTTSANDGRDRLDAYRPCSTFFRPR